MLKVYVVIFPNIQTGGIELLHQLCRELNRHRNIVAELLFPYKGNMYVPKSYLSYMCPYSVMMDEELPKDADESVFIVPETLVGYYYEGEPFYKCKNKCIYWESVDNYYAATPEHLRPDFRKYPKILHLTQSYYARRFLLDTAGVDENMIIDVSDYLNPALLQEYDDSLNTREKIVLYNPRKGMEFTEKIIEYMPNVKFTAVNGLTPTGIRNLMQRSMIYIDFGSHPGKDRIPREAAVNGMVVITGRDGSAGYKEDVPIPEECKFHRKAENIPAIAAKIEDIFLNFKDYQDIYADYRQMIYTEPALFTEQVTRLVTKLMLLFNMENINSVAEETLPHDLPDIGFREESNAILITKGLNDFLYTKNIICRVYNPCMLRSGEDNPIYIDAICVMDDQDELYNTDIDGINRLGYEEMLSIKKNDSTYIYIVTEAIYTAMDKIVPELLVTSEDNVYFCPNIPENDGVLYIYEPSKVVLPVHRRCDAPTSVMTTNSFSMLDGQVWNYVYKSAKKPVNELMELLDDTLKNTNKDGRKLLGRIMELWDRVSVINSIAELKLITDIYHDELTHNEEHTILSIADNRHEFLSVLHALQYEFFRLEFNKCRDKGNNICSLTRRYSISRCFLNMLIDTCTLDKFRVSFTLAGFYLEHSMLKYAYYCLLKCDTIEPGREDIKALLDGFKQFASR